MTDKERLEEFEKFIKDKTKSDVEKGIEINYAPLKALELIYLLIERIEELEHEKEHLELIKERQEEEYRKLYEKNKRYHEAIEKAMKVLEERYTTKGTAHMILEDAILDEVLEGEE